MSWLQKYKIFGSTILVDLEIFKKMLEIAYLLETPLFRHFFFLIALPIFLHFCNQLIKPVLLIPINPRFITKFFSPLLGVVHFFSVDAATLNTNFVDPKFLPHFNMTYFNGNKLFPNFFGTTTFLTALVLLHPSSQQFYGVHNTQSIHCQIVNAYWLATWTFCNVTEIALPLPHLTPASTQLGKVRVNFISLSRLSLSLVSLSSRRYGSWAFTPKTFITSQKIDILT